MNPTQTPQFDSAVNVNTQKIAKPVDPASNSAMSGVLGYGTGGNAIYAKGKDPNASVVAISNTNKKDQVKNMQAEYTNLSNKGVRTDATGTPRYADNSMYEEPKLADTKTEDDQIANEIESLRASTDEVTKQALDNISQKYSLRESEMRRINENQKKAAETTLLGLGSRQYAPLSSQGAISSIESEGVRRLARLDAEENDEIAKAKAAQLAGKYKLMNDIVENIKTKRAEKVELAQQLNTQALNRNEEYRKRAEQVERESDVAELYANGITDPAEIMTKLTESGKNVTIADIKATLQAVVPPGLDDLIKTAQNNGAPVEVLKKLATANTIDEAYDIAGAYAAGGTGDVGEYNFYKASMLAAGHQPKSYLEFIRAKKLAETVARPKSGGSASVSGKSSGATSGSYGSDLDLLIDNAASTIKSKFGQEQFYNSIKRARNDADKIRTITTAVLSGSPANVKTDYINQSNAIGQVDKAIKLLDEGVKTGVLNSAAQYAYDKAGRNFDPKLAQINQLIVAAIQPYRSSVTGAAWGPQEDAEYNALFGSTKYTPETLKQRLEGVKQIMKDKTISAIASQAGFGDNQEILQKNGESIAQQDIASENQAMEIISSYGDSNPQVRESIVKMEQDGVPYTKIKLILGL